MNSFITIGKGPYFLKESHSLNFLAMGLEMELPSENVTKCLNIEIHSQPLYTLTVYLIQLGIASNKMAQYNCNSPNSKV